MQPVFTSGIRNSQPFIFSSSHTPSEQNACQPARNWRHADAHGLSFRQTRVARAGG